jgi:hypothetical protein
MPISIADLPRIAEAVDDLIRAIKSFEREGGSVAISERLQQARKALVDLLSPSGAQAKPARNSDILDSQLSLSVKEVLHELWVDSITVKLWAYTIPNTPELARAKLERVLTVLGAAAPHFPKLTPAVRKAYLAFECAQRTAERKLEDWEAYELLKEKGVPDDGPGELADYRLPAKDTFFRYLGKARQALNEQKYTRRRGRSHGKSIVRADQIERPENGD